MEITNKNLAQIIEKRLEEECQPLKDVKMPEVIKELYDGILTVKPEVVEELAKTIRQDLIYMIGMVAENRIKPICFIDYLLREEYQSGYSYAVGPACTCEYRENDYLPDFHQYILWYEDWFHDEDDDNMYSISESLHYQVFREEEVRGSEDEAFFNKYDPYLDDYDDYDLSWAQMTKYTHLACLQLEKEGFFQSPSVKKALQRPFYVAIRPTDTNPVAYVLHPK